MENKNIKNSLAIIPYIFIFILLLSSNGYGQKSVTVEKKGNAIAIENKYIRMVFDLSSGLYKGFDKAKNELVIDSAYASINRLFKTTDPHVTNNWEAETVEDELGNGKKLTIVSEKKTGTTLPKQILKITLYAEKKYVVFNIGLKNTTEYPVQLKELHPITGNAFTDVEDKDDFYMLDGNGGGEITEVTEEDHLKSRNNLLITFRSEKNPRSLVFGGLTYHDFEKFSEVKRQTDGEYFTLDVWSKDPVGKKVKKGATYLPNDKFYLDFVTADPFESLEEYGLAVRTAQHIDLNMYTFPTVGLWYSGEPQYGGGTNHNDTPGAVWEMEQAVKNGFLKYSKVAIRLVPDNYGVNNQQGWWDDKHWQMYGDERFDIGPSYQPPYETTKKWGQAITERGGIPLTYFQTSRQSEDYVVEHPDHMLFNTSSQPRWWRERDKTYHGYDFTDSGFVNHMRKVYSNLKNGGIKGLMFDYAWTGWASEGGFEDKFSTTAEAYRKIFKLAADGLGEEHYIHERNLARGSDITLGLVTSQRNWGDTDRINPTMITRNGLRWYKNRVVVNYDMDAKNPFHAKPDNRDGVRAMFTMSYVVSGRLLLGAGFDQMTSAMIKDLSRIYPFHSTPQNARPIDAFSEKKYPQIYDFEVNPDWHQLTFYNTKRDSTGKYISSKISVNLGKNTAAGGLGLSSNTTYLIYDFWNDRYIGRFKGSKVFEQRLRPGEARMMSIHKEQEHPQFISTNRHIMQGYIDLDNVRWDPDQNKLSGVAKVVRDEPYRIIIATNGYSSIASKASKGKTTIDKIADEDGLIELRIQTSQNEDVEWSLTFKK